MAGRRPCPESTGLEDPSTDVNQSSDRRNLGDCLSRVNAWALAREFYVEMCGSADECLTRRAGLQLSAPARNTKAQTTVGSGF